MNNHKKRRDIDDQNIDMYIVLPDIENRLFNYHSLLLFLSSIVVGLFELIKYYRLLSRRDFSFSTNKEFDTLLSSPNRLGQKISGGLYN